MPLQAALVADSPFYKLLVGRVLGYKEENIWHHIQVGELSFGGRAGGTQACMNWAFGLQVLTHATPCCCH